MTNFQKVIILLLKSALIGTEEKIPENIEWNEILKIGKEHQIIPMLYYGAINSKLSLDMEIKSEFENILFQNILVDQKQRYQLDQITKAFNENNINYMLFKGSVLKNIYPKPEMRPMGDADILIKLNQSEKIDKIVKEFGFVFIDDKDPEIVYDKRGVLHLELHKRMVSPKNVDFYNYYGEEWDFATQSSNNKNLFEMKIEEHLIYLVVHLAKHYRNGGIGIRHLTDIYVFINKYKDLDKEYLYSSLEKLHLLKFYENLIYTINVWFEDIENSKISDLITNYIFSSGSYGTNQSLELSNAAKADKIDNNLKSYKAKNIFFTVFLPYSIMCGKYKILKKAPILLPIMWFVRCIDILLFKNHKIKKYKESINQLNNETIDNFYNDLLYVGLDFNFKE